MMLRKSLYHHLLMIGLVDLVAQAIDIRLAPRGTWGYRSPAESGFRLFSPNTGVLNVVPRRYNLHSQALRPWVVKMNMNLATHPSGCDYSRASDWFVVRHIVTCSRDTSDVSQKLEEDPRR